LNSPAQAEPSPGAPADKNVAVVALIDDRQRIFLVRTRFLADFWQPVGGKSIARDSSPARTAVRETREETGLELAPEDLEFEIAVDWDLGVGKVYCFSAQISSDRPITLFDQELLEGNWFELHEAAELPSLTATNIFIRHLLEARRATGESPAPAARTPGPDLGSGDPAAPNGTRSDTGTMADVQLLPLFRQGILIASGFEEERLGGSCYELRASRTYYMLCDGKQRFEVADDGYLLLKPQQLYVLITEESLALPRDVMGRVVSKGSLFSVGLLPINTWVDPGFAGRLGIVYYNSSLNYLKIYPGRSIAKIEFVRLGHMVDRPYTGQHGFGSGIWPVSEDVILTPEEIGNDPRIGDPLDEALAMLSKPISKAIRRVFVFERYLIGAMLTYILFALLLIGLAKGGKSLDLAPSIGLGIAANILTGGLTLLATRLSRER
jgi:dCTP deaminase